MHRNKMGSSVETRARMISPDGLDKSTFEKVSVSRANTLTEFSCFTESMAWHDAKSPGPRVKGPRLCFSPASGCTCEHVQTLRNLTF